VSRIVRDLRCPLGHYEVSVLYNTSEELPRCTHVPPEGAIPCNLPRTTFYATQEMTNDARAAAVHTFKPFEVDGGVRITSEEGALRYRQSVAAQKGVPVEHIQFNSRGNVPQTVDELRHRARDIRRREGFDERTFESYRTERNRITAEQSGRGNNPNPTVGYRRSRER
jgi:hypothetical protein